jgi:DNA polymerase I-like protein with 3'-5' exonuclease and polymerase domains
MIVNIDAKQIEWLAAVFWSQDQVGIDEIIQGIDQHEDNQKRFKLPSRLIAKTLLFRTIYGGTGYSFATDPEFSSLGGEGWWDEKITKFYEKYKGLRSWHERLYQRVVLAGGRLDLPTGRSYQFTPVRSRTGQFSGEVRYPRTKILNYPVQGLAADLMAIARVSLHKRIKAMNFNGIQWVNTVHDSCVLDIKPEIWYTISNEMVDVIQETFRDIPLNFKKLFDVEFNLPIRAEISYGKDWGNMETINAS